ncbi:MAG: hypothetical protein E7B29_01155 [Mixta calida]|nr:hypothetical protein [Mixta calida]
MTGFKGTPGPWITADAHGPVDGGDCIQEVSSEHKFFVATCCHYTSREGVKANARLIAAAPELLEALQTYMAAVNQMNVAMNDGVNVQGAMSNLVGSEDMARAAIAKALGNN